MKIIVEADNDQMLELETIEGVNWVRVSNDDNFNQHSDAVAYFNLANKDYNKYFQLPVVFLTQNKDSLQLKSNIFLINDWPGFLSRKIWEISGPKSDLADNLVSNLGKKAIWVKGEFVSNRVISMIINEAYFAFEEKVSSKEEINTAMKLGTGYSYGPFEWAEKIGKKKIYDLLFHLSKTDKRYNPSDSLKNEAHI